MALDMDILDKGEYLYVKVAGPFEIDTAKLTFSKMLDAICEQRKFKVLVDFRDVGGRITLADKLNLIEFAMAELQKAYSERDIKAPRFALLRSEALMDKIEEDLAVNRGAIAKITTDEKEALDYLMG